MGSVINAPRESRCICYSQVPLYWVPHKSLKRAPIISRLTNTRALLAARGAFVRPFCRELAIGTDVRFSFSGTFLCVGYLLKFLLTTV